jgi:hypothetical protein
MGMCDAPILSMSIAVDQTKLRRIIDSIVANEDLNRNEVTMVLQIAQLAAGSDDVERPIEHSLLQAIAQRVGALVGIKPDELSDIPRIDDDDARLSRLRALAAELHTRAARELAFAMAFLVSISDLDLAAVERTDLEELQHAIGVDDRRAMDLVVQLTETIAQERTETVIPG